jgi:CDGSH-type Zn-finger protein
VKFTKITATVDGPLKIDGPATIKNSTGKIFESPEEVFLCRCGGSSNKPFCDGTHNKNGFSGDNNPVHIKPEGKAYVGKDITIYDNRSLCSHRGYCTTQLPNVFKKTEPPIDPDGDTALNIIAQCDKCPSGALSYALPNEQQPSVMEESKDGTTIRLSEKHYGFHGPYDIKGDYKLYGQIKLMPETKVKTTLCRCGHSKNKPYCSGEHYYVQFTDEKNE